MDSLVGSQWSIVIKTENKWSVIIIQIVRLSAYEGARRPFQFCTNFLSFVNGVILE